ncbi:MAG: hypothetical protein HFF89_04470 [Oscillibacter sp.]|jgi:hypothetical protein|nr:hypothetical protein [Oscillibacter sp.]MCI8691061.1 hypothetical protein [Oscillibacter sp.]MCI9376286.1 hypothetical protein [Oscillibacter sp.]
MKRRRNGLPSLLGGLLVPVIAAAALLCFATALDSLDSGRAEEDLRQLEETLRRGCVACYAAEGVYPPSIDYLKDHYGLQVDEARYTVRYSAFAENLMPDITVLENAP